MNSGREGMPGEAERVPVVALGASAGGLEPLEAFFETVPPDSGYCFVVLQHLSPDRRSMMDEILSRRTGLTIRHVTEGAKIEPDTIFLNLPGTLVSLIDDRFMLTPYAEGDPLPHLPIDTFFMSLSRRGGGKCAAVVLSGSGLDGAAGATAIRQTGGSVFVQSPAEARFDSMPRAAILAGSASGVLPAPQIMKAITAAFEGLEDEPRPEKEQMPSDEILMALERAHRVDFSAYKRPTVMRRIERRHQLRGMSTIEAYRDFVVKNPEALEELYHDLLIGVTEFYRDPEAFSELRSKALMPLVEASQKDMREIRVWVLACASGEEAYTIAIELSEAFRIAGYQPNFRVIATDVHRPSIERAAASIYSDEALKKLPREIKERYFIRHRQGWLVDPVLRRRVIFSVHDVMRDPPFMQLDLLTCRNLLIYLKEAAQDRTFAKFVFALRKGGYLFLGPSESIRQKIDDFVPIDTKWRIYRKDSDRRVLERSMLMEAVMANQSAPPPLAHRDQSREVAQDLPARPPLTMVDQTQGARPDRDSLLRGYDALLRRFAPSSILITSDGAVLTWFGAAGAYIDTMSNLAEWTVDEIVHSDLRYAINLGIERLMRAGDNHYKRTAQVTGENGETHSIEVSMSPLSGSASGRRFLLASLKRTGEAEPVEEADEGANEVSSEQETGTQGDNALLVGRIRELERDLRLTEESLQYVTERLEASGEELQASNEELQASNEELQASNEELQASNEELHAVNEELVSVSAEHERKIEMLSDLNYDMERVFESIEAGMIMLDKDLRISRFTHACGNVFELEHQDVGRNIANVGARPEFVDLAALARAAKDSGREQVASGTFRGGDMTIRANTVAAASTGRGGVILLVTGGAVEAVIKGRHDGGGDGS
ncbi:CheR family methyltransferase [Amaricoccus macauensis]|uniref:CheR family methyltransferase n=1 Tax=Amaricoccus macauensis TaxID=57001 RepID=UPI003C7D3D9B